MSRTNRVRSFDWGTMANGTRKEYYSYIVIGTYSVNGAPFGYNNTFKLKEGYSNDWVGKPFVDSPLTLKSYSMTPAYYNTAGRQRYGTSSFYYELINAPLAIPKPTNWEANPNWDILAAQAMANANPNAARVDVPLFLFELRDLPRLIQQTRKLYRLVKKPSDLKRVVSPTLGETNLAYQFGLKPMVNDLVKLFDFLAGVEKHKEYLLRLQKETVVQRALGSTEGTGVLWNNPTQYYPPNIAGTKAVLVRGPLYQTYSYVDDSWFSMKVKLLDELPATPEGLTKLSRDTVLGLYANLDTAWNAIPFSWLIDWFTNFGDLISLTRGRIRYEWRDLNIMFHRSVSADVEVVKYSDAISGPDKIELRMEQKLRHVRSTPYAFPAFELPLISTYQAGILGSLALTSGKTRFRT